MQKQDQPGYGKPGRWMRSFGGSVPVNFEPPKQSVASLLARMRSRAPKGEPLRAQRRRALKLFAKQKGERFRDVWAFYQEKKLTDAAA